MKYQVGDRVKLFSRETKKFNREIEHFLDRTDRILTITEIHKELENNTDFDSYRVKEITGYNWFDDEIECLVEAYKMKYKVGDTVRIKTWEEMKNEFGDKLLIDNIEFTSHLEDIINQKAIDRILTIKKVHKIHYTMQELPPFPSDFLSGNTDWELSDGMIVGIDVLDPINNRWEILDIR